MNSLAYFSLLSMLIGADPQMERVPGKFILTAATLWKINAADKVSGEKLVEVWGDAQLAKHNVDGERFWVFDRKRVGDGKNAFVQFFQKNDQTEKKDEEFYVDDKDVTAKLREMGINIPKEPTRLTPSIGGFGPLMTNAGTKLSSWYIVGGASMPAADSEEDGEGGGESKPTALPMRSVLLEWGAKEKTADIDALEKSMRAPAKAEAKADAKSDSKAEGKPAEGLASTTDSLIYQRHFIAVPIKAELYASTLADDENSAGRKVSEVAGLYAIRPRYAAEKKGFIAYLVNSNSKRRLLLFESPTFESSDTETKIEVPAKCFFDFVIGPELQRSSVSCRLGKGATTACSEKREGYTAIAAQFVAPGSKETQPTNSVSLATNVKGESFEMRLVPGPSVKLPITDTTEKLLITADGCKAVPITVEK